MYRTFPMQVVAGAGAREEAIARSRGLPLPPIPVTLRETECNLQFDFRRVYWNSRLQHEHRHMVEAIVDAGIPGAGGSLAASGGSIGSHAESSSLAAAASSGAGTGAVASVPAVAGKKRKRDKARAASGRGIVVADACAGVGPFAVPLAKRGAQVLANDLNPESYRWLVANASGNKCGQLLIPCRDDGANFLVRHVAAAQGEPVGPLRLPDAEEES